MAFYVGKKGSLHVEDGLTLEPKSRIPDTVVAKLQNKVCWGLFLKDGTIREVEDKKSVALEAAREAGVIAELPDEDEDEIEHLESEQISPRDEHAPTEIATKAVKSERAKSRPKALWDADPATLAGKSLEQLNHMIADRQKNRRPAKTVEEAVVILTADRPKAPAADAKVDAPPPPPPA